MNANNFLFTYLYLIDNSNWKFLLSLFGDVLACFLFLIYQYDFKIIPELLIMVIQYSTVRYFPFSGCLYQNLFK